MRLDRDSVNFISLLVSHLHRDLSKMLFSRVLFFQNSLILEIAELYKKFPSVKEYYQVQGGNTEAVLEKYKDTSKKNF